MLLLIPLLLRRMSSGLIAVLEFLCLWHPLSVGCPCQIFLSFLFNQCVFFFVSLNFMKIKGCKQ